MKTTSERKPSAKKPYSSLGKGKEIPKNALPSIRPVQKECQNKESKTISAKIEVQIEDDTKNEKVGKKTYK